METKTKKGEYHIVVTLNDKTYECDTDDVIEAIVDLKPEFLRTRVLIDITKGDRTLSRMYYLREGKRLFYNQYAQAALLKSLIF